MTDQTAKSALNQIFDETSFLYGANAAFLEDLYAQYAVDPSSVDASWRSVFDALGDGAAQILDEAQAGKPSVEAPVPEYGDLLGAYENGALASDEPSSALLRAKAARRMPGASVEDLRAATIDSIRALMLIRAYRIRGHLIAHLDPLQLDPPAYHPELDPKTYGFTEADFDRTIFIDNVLGMESASLNQILEVVKRTYCGAFAVQFMHIADPEEKAWIQERIEGPDKAIAFTPEGKRAIFNKLVEAEGFEKFLGVKYTGTKRFGLDGAEALVPAMEQIIKRGGALGVKEIILGMPHRGRLNVLANVMGKPFQAIFNEFKGGASHPDDVDGSGDVKYHLGASSDRAFDDNNVHLSLTANPSHLEAVNPVVLGKARAKQSLWAVDKPLEEAPDRGTVLPVLLHGDAAFAGQGVVAECFAMSGLKGHRTGGTIHIIVNNQIGFTTAPRFGRSSPYPSDVALMVQAPIFHVNGDDPEAVVYAAKVAMEFRQKFRRDVVIDMFCYRRFGHNEGDEPSFTQPLMYKRIKGHPSTLKIYADRLITEGLLTEEDVDEVIHHFHESLQTDFEAADNFRPNKADWLDGQWSGLGRAVGDERRGETAVETDKLKSIGKVLTKLPQGFNGHRTLNRILKAKQAMFESGEGFDWATAEALAFGSLVLDGQYVRLCGQDSGRGTFSQRHSYFVDQQSEERYHPLNHLEDDQRGEFEVVDSFLSEFAVLGFEYGYSLADPKSLIMWEAQFGDFANGAQVMIDQFISSGERKWLRMSGLVLLLPHGYEGQGPEHSSARLERFLQLCAEDNMQVANCTTPANYFHILRRQMHRNFRKPLILMTPKSLLRHKRAVSTLDEMGPGSSFHRVLWDDAERMPGSSIELRPDNEIKRVILCSGKVYYDLFEAREKRGIDDVQILRVEQLYPFPAKSLMNELSRFPEADVVWCQEEPKNMGGWTFMEPNIEWVLDRIEARTKRAHYVGRGAMASTATGLVSQHLKTLEAFLDEALTL